MNKNGTELQIFGPLWEKAIENGWKNPEPLETIDIFRTVFSPEFLKALFPLDGFPSKKTKDVLSTPWHSGSKGTIRRVTRPIKGSWQYHAQEAIISDNPLKYIYDAVFGGTSFIARDSHKRDVLWMTGDEWLRRFSYRFGYTNNGESIIKDADQMAKWALKSAEQAAGIGISPQAGSSMNLLDDRLHRELTDILFRVAGGLTNMGEIEIEQIMKAFKNAGYWEQSFPEPMMTGEEWYYKFKKELDKEPPPVRVATAVDKAAKRASGIDDDK